MSHQESSLSGFIKGIVLGGLIGAGVAALLTPQTGEETRKMLKKKSKDMEKKARRFVEDVSENLEENKEDLQKDLQKKINAVSSVIEKKADNINAFLDDKNVQHAVTSTKKSLDESRKALEDLWSRRLSRVKEEEPRKKEASVKNTKDSSEVELARKILSRASGRSFYKKSSRR
ncbi:hypothetical protein A2X44_02720 [candidate division CPR3 bacterium GWF2_35_18]|uniref:General stress protein n=1 Tax=candidate division CPR3 bacterium GW2011_GWF2_35_18 TaxID=1618350 RepID=A0A0G0BIM4_UNCC3|nr:MAG: hypothetical protein UR67_C0008G0034 [candidate division CPR3 bacterium GW2011_GWF2_35_18]KKP86879.1 MAG: hypothetical protein UR87_C0009G0008 [candidate division CPR3 bacterium GW2011_GWE2_35_7]OGB62504.1 MAG: hypothetical protein A2X44_02720 [candidate division CPR3 bacterium GWF2_35_18]OGB65548.1 MAG: hypothetical protein A2250_04300 [candidate division CPR3 bacterium RIFOXYA2_FULL_35_13]OGB76895.1 MAG: hypothetical protein A2476_03665 [candidate division CPR3 bacterium RIFOXYC2_FULL